MSTLERLFNAMNLHIEENKTVTKVGNGIKSIIQCNNKPIVTESSSIRELVLKNRNQSIQFNTHSKLRDCSYLFLEQYMHEVLSSQIDFMISKILEFCHNPELYNQVKSQKLNQLLLKLVKNDSINFNNTGENTLLNKWEKVNEKISEKSIQDGLVSLNYKIDDVCVEDEKMIEYYQKVCKVPGSEKSIFAFFMAYISVEFPLYNLAKQTKGQLMGVQFEKNELEVIKTIYQYIFENVDKKNSYSLLDKPLLKDKAKSDIEKIYIVERLEDAVAPTMLLIQTFNSLTSHIDSILDDIVDMDEALVTDKKFNLNLTKEEIDSLKSCNEFTINKNFGSTLDFKSEIKSNPRISFEEFNKQQNEVLIKSNRKVTVSQPQRTRRSNYQNLNNSPMPFSLPVVSKTITSFRTTLDPEDESFEKVIPNEERRRNTHIIANSGAGKSTILKTFISKDIKEGNTVIVMDPDGEFAEQVAQMVDDPAKLVYIDPNAKEGKTPTINPLQIEYNGDEKVISSSTQELVGAFENGMGLEWSVNMEATLYPCISTLIRKGDADIHDLQRFMNKDHNQDLVELGKKSPIRAHREFFQKQFNQEKLDVTRDALGTKLQLLLNDQVFSNLVSGKNTIHLEKEINTEGKIIVFKLSVGEMIKTLTLFSRLIMAMIQGIVFRRSKLPKNQIPNTHLYLDEFEHFVNPTIETMLTQSRKKKAYTTLAHQTITGQLTKKVQDVVSSCTHYKLAGQNSYDNHKIMSKALQVDIDVLQNLENGCFISKVGSNPSIEVKYSNKFIGDNASIVDKEKWNEYLEYQTEKYYRVVEDESLDSVANSDVVLLPKHKDF